MPGSLEKPAAALLPMKEKLTKRIGKLPILIKQVGSLILNMMQEAGLYLKARLHQKIRTMTECQTTGKMKTTWTKRMQLIEIQCLRMDTPCRSEEHTSELQSLMRI